MPTEKLKDYLDSQGIEYETIEHSPASSQIDLEHLKSALSADSVSLAGEDEFEDRFWSGGSVDDLYEEIGGDPGPRGRTPLRGDPREVRPAGIAGLL